LDYTNLKIEYLEPKGRCVFTTAAIAKWAEVLEFKGDFIHASEIEDPTHCLQIDDEVFLASTGGIDDFINHSCDPCCGVRLTTDRRVVLFALKDIEANIEITFDYATAQNGEYEVLTCRCLSTNCREKIGGFNELPAKLQQFYISANAVLPFLTKL